MSTIFDVAKLANVSIKTVSRVTNDESSVRPATREKVTAAIAQLNYTPHKGAQMMRAAKSGVFGMITGAISSTRRRSSDAGLSSIHIIRGAQEVMKKSNKLLMIADSEGDTDELDAIMHTFLAHSVDGVIIAADYHQQLILPLRKHLPLVIANGFDAANTPSVVPDDFQGQYNATKYLIDKGHKKIGMITLNDDAIATKLRSEGFHEALQSIGSQAKGYYMTGFDPHSSNPFSLLPNAIDAMLENFAPSAICFGNDIMAMRARAYLTHKGVNIPDELSIIGFDNDIAICEALTPALTTINLPYLEMGARAAERLLSIAKGNNEVGIDKIACNLIKRKTISNIG